MIFLNFEHDLVFGCLYIPPKNTKYSSEEAFIEIEAEMLQIVKSDELIGIVGDFNAKTGLLLDFVETDESLLDIFDLNDNFHLINYMYDYENSVKFGVAL